MNYFTDGKLDNTVYDIDENYLKKMLDEFDFATCYYDNESKRWLNMIQMGNHFGISSMSIRYFRESQII